MRKSGEVTIIQEKEVQYAASKRKFDRALRSFKRFQLKSQRRETKKGKWKR